MPTSTLRHHVGIERADGSETVSTTSKCLHKLTGLVGEGEGAAKGKEARFPQLSAKREHETGWDQDVLLQIVQETRVP